MRLRYGWSFDLDTLSRYVHMANKDMDEIYAALYKGREAKGYNNRGVTGGAWSARH